MSDYISTTDYSGRKVSCPRYRWFGHVIVGHQIMKNNKEAVEETITSPDIVFQSGEYDKREVYFKETSSASYSNKFKTKVIVEYDESDVGEIVTAFPIKDVKGGIGNVIYQKEED